MTTQEIFKFDNTYASQLEGLYTPWQGAQFPRPAMVKFNRELAAELGLDADALDSASGAAILSGSVAPIGASPLAQVYAGHQFGGYSAQLGDGRALLVGELVDKSGHRRDLHLKGSGPTPFSRGGDGKAAIGPVLREYLVGEFMHAVGIPTTRSLAATTTGESVFREVPLPGAVLARVASSHLRVGTFQYFANSGVKGQLKQLADYAIRRHDPQLVDSEAPYLEFLRAVIKRQAELVAQWMALGFVHGVMNTDNTTISGETIDYGPCAFMDSYDPNSVFSSIDRNGRYAFVNQPPAAKWNLARFAEALLDLIDPSDTDRAIQSATDAVEGFAQIYESRWLSAMRAKLGMQKTDPDDKALIDALLTAMEAKAMDYTSTFRKLAQTLRSQETDADNAFGHSEELGAWLSRWHKRLAMEADEPQALAAAMDRKNPLYIPRNHRVEAALEAATALDFGPFEELLGVLAQPYTRREGLESFTQPAPSEFGPYVTYCGT